MGHVTDFVGKSTGFPPKNDFSLFFNFSRTVSLRSCDSPLLWSPFGQKTECFSRATECSLIPSRVIAACFALIAFAAALVVGLAAGNPAGTILWRALVAMFVCWAAGAAVGWLAQRAVQVQVDDYKAKHPIPSEEAVASVDPSPVSAQEPIATSAAKPSPPQTRAA